MNQAVANRLLRMDRTIEAVDGKLDEVLRLLRPIATPVGVIHTPGSALAVEQVVACASGLPPATPEPEPVGMPFAPSVRVALHEFGHDPAPGVGPGEAVRAALHAERRARDAANVEAGEARAEAAALRRELAAALAARREAEVEAGRARRRYEAARDANVRNETAEMWESQARFLASMWPGGPVEIRGAGDVLVLPGVPGRRRWWGRRRR